MSHRNFSRKHILLVEDDATDILHFQRLIRKESINADLHVVRSGDEALKELRKWPATPGGHIIITDLNLPGMSGHELIDEVRSDPTLKSSVMFVFSTSDLPDDISRAYRQNIAGYFIKDGDGNNLSAVISMLRHYLHSVTLL